jgi:predicted nucleic acid-binding protein
MAAAYFADTFYWVALGHSRDAWHRRVVTWQQSNPTTPLITTDEVLGEVLTWFAPLGPTWRAVAASMVKRVLANPQVQVLHQTHADFLAALSFYEARLDKDYSLIDCRSMVAMRALGISDALTNDHHFSQEGFAVVFP